METEPHMNRSRTLIVPALLALTLTACGDEGSSATSSEDALPSTAASEAAEPSEAAASEAAEPSEDAGGRNITLTDFAFSEGELTVAVGDTVTFRNSGSAPHTVTEGTDGVEADGSSFNEQVSPGDEVEITFDEAGTFDVTCLFHPQMNMTVVVEG
jgi:plastocyanin